MTPGFHPATPTLVLMGLRASGKSTLAQEIGAQTGVNAKDLDPLVLDLLGAGTVREAWSRFGEDAFREAETHTLAELLAEDEPLVLALGGGTPTAPGAADLLRAAASAGRCTTVYLRLTPERLRERMRAHDPDRPSLTGGDAMEEIQRVFEARDGLYRELAQDEYAPTKSAREDAAAVIALWEG